MRDGMRLVSVVLGSTSMKARENASAALLNYGFTFYDTKLVVKGGTALATDARLEGGQAHRSISASRMICTSRCRAASPTSKTAVDVQPQLDRAACGWMPNVGTLRVFAGNQALATLPLHPLKAVAAGGWWRRLIDTIRLWFA